MRYTEDKRYVYKGLGEARKQLYNIIKEMECDTATINAVSVYFLAWRQLNWRYVGDYSSFELYIFESIINVITRETFARLWASREDMAEGIDVLFWAASSLACQEYKNESVAY